MRIEYAAFAVLSTALAASAQPGRPACDGKICAFSLSFLDGAASVVGTTGAAFSGQEQDTDSRTLANGTHLSNQSARNMTYRDSKGRVRTERHAYPPAPEGQQANPNDFVIAEIHDPVVGFAYILDPVSKVAYRMAIPRNLRNWNPATITNGQEPAGPNATVEFLGTKAISGITAYGEKTTSTLTSTVSIAVTIVEERWVAPASGVALLSKTTRTGSDNVMTTAEANYSEGEPDASLFQIPAGYKTVDGTGPFQAVHKQTGGGGSSGTYGPWLMSSCEGGICEITFDPGNVPAGVRTGSPYSAHEVVTSAGNNKSVAGDAGGDGQYRDSNGRTRTDRAPASGGLPIATKQGIVKIEDPTAGYIYILNPATQTAYRSRIRFLSVVFQWRPMHPAGPFRVANGIVNMIEDLPPQTLFGINAIGQRNTITYPPNSYNGNDQTVAIVSEIWVDPKTGITIMSKNNGVKGDTTRSMPDYKEGEPDPALFGVPEGYKIVDEPGKFSFTAPAAAQ